MDSNFFNKNASRIESTLANKKISLNNNEDRFDRISLNTSNLEENNSNTEKNNDIVMKKIILQEPTKLKEERSANSEYTSVNCKFFYLKNSFEN